MRIIASIPSYHERLFLDYSIRSVYDFVDEIILTDTGMKASIDAGFRHQSTDGTQEIIDKWKNDKKIHIIQNQNEPLTFKELMSPALSLAKEMHGDWLFTVGADEIWPRQALLPMRKVLNACDKNGILGLNVWMLMFAPDFWNFKDFRNPRFAKITDDCELSWGDSMRWPKLGVYQYAGDTVVPVPVGIPEHVAEVNSDYPKIFSAFHYSCVGEERVKFKAQFYKSFDGSTGDKYVAAYLEKNWLKFKEMGFKRFFGKHPEVVLEHPLFNQKLF